MIVANNLSLDLGGNTIFQNLDFVINEGTITQIEGPNGSGKSSLLKCIVGIYNNFEGDISIDSCAVLPSNLTKYAKLISFFIDKDFSYSYLSVKDNLKIFSYYNGITNLDPDLEQLFSDFNLSQFLDVKVSKLSAGYRQKFEIILSMLNSGTYVLLDEPVVNLDSASIDVLYDYLQKSVKNNRSYLVVSHNDAKLAELAHQQIKLEL
ncbi:ATP-binding cassette domain-containing protein [Daejeonella sp.]|jgi:ATP-binding cassette subfamily B protein|uniref:ABC transporter ATP-binding protein n=1 Tax=Daejeonella sp. TaxID=2805397 RepID=UPI003782D88F